MSTTTPAVLDAPAAPTPQHTDNTPTAHAPPNPNLAFTKAVLAFQNTRHAHENQPEPAPKPAPKSAPHHVATKHPPVKKPVKRVVTKVKGVAETPEPDPEAIELKAHQERHHQRVRIMRGVQHLLTGVLSVVVAGLQGAIYVKYQQTKSIPGAWPQNPNLLPTLMLFGTAITGLTFDVAALVAYALPQTSIGKKAVMLARRANTAVTTIKTTAYGFSTVVCRAGYTQGNTTGMNNDLWSWSCSPKGAAQQPIINASTNCTSSTVAWILSIASIAIQVIGIIIDQVVAADAKKFGASKSEAEDSKPLLSGKKGKKDDNDNDDEDEYVELDKLTQDYDDQLNDMLKPQAKKK